MDGMDGIYRIDMDRHGSTAGQEATPHLSAFNPTRDAKSADPGRETRPAVSAAVLTTFRNGGGRTDK